VFEVVRTLFCKYDGRPHRQVQSIRLGEDEHGLWVGSLPGGLGRRGDGRWVTIDHTRVRLFPRGAWWSALFNDEPHETAVYCDITTPAEIVHDDLGVQTVTTVDLDLDVRRMRDGTVRVLDEDEFAAHQVKYGYPQRVVDTARATCDWVAANITTAEPFSSAYQPYLQRVKDLVPVR
jgi:protein associated with RNAse G/E